MCTSWENVILSWVKVCAVGSDDVNKLEDLSDEKLLGHFVPSCVEDAEANLHQKIITFIQRQYPRFWTQMPSELQNEDTLIVYSLLIHYYSLNDDPLMRNKMCTLSNAFQLQIKRFLEFLWNKDITKDTVQTAIKSCCESPVQSLINFFEKSRRESKTPLGAFLKLSNRSHSLPKMFKELKKEHIQEEGDKFLRSETSKQRSESETFQKTCLETHGKIPTEVSRHTILEQKSSTSEALAVAERKFDKNVSLEWDYTDVFEDLCTTAICDSTTVDVFTEDTENMNGFLLNLDLNPVKGSVCLECDCLKKEIEEKDLNLHDVETKMTLKEKEIILKNKELTSKVNEVSKLNDVVQNMAEDNLEMSKGVKLLQDELNVVSECISNKSEILENEQRIIKDPKAQNHEKMEEISLTETMLVAKIDDIAKLTKQLESTHHESTEKQNIILNVREERELLQKKLAENDELKDIISAKNESLRQKDNQIEKQVESINSLTRDLEDRNSKIVFLSEKVIALKEEWIQLKITTLQDLSGIKSPIESVAWENDILRKDKLLLEKKLIESEVLIGELKSKIASSEELIEKNKTAENHMDKQIEENVSRHTNISEEQVRAAEVLKKYTNLKIKYVQKATECGKIKEFYEKQLSSWKERSQAAFSEEKEKIIMENNCTVLHLEKSLELYKKRFMICHDDALNLRKQVRDLHEKLLKINDEKVKLEIKLSSLNRNKAKCGVIEDRHAFFREQVSEELYISSCKRSVPLPVEGEPELVTYVKNGNIRRELIHLGTAAPPPQTKGNEEFNAKRVEDLKPKRGTVGPSEEKPLIEYQRRNSMVLPHLKSSYPGTDCTEMLRATEDETKFGSGGVQERRNII